MKRFSVSRAFLAALTICAFLGGALRAQDSTAALSGSVKNPTGAAVAHAKISAKSLATGESQETETDAAGHYSFANLAPGDYEISVSAESFAAQTVKLTLAAGSSQTSDFALVAAPPTESKPAEEPGKNVAAPSLEDLGITQQQTQGSAQDQARLNKRSHMLMLHQRFGLIATVPLAAAVITSFGAGGRETDKADRWTHLALGSATGDLYFLSAYYAIFAPKIQGTHPRGHIRLHRAMAWIHGPGMIATPILGAIAFDQKSKGEHVHGIAQAHGPVAIVTAAAYGIAIASVSFKF